MWKTNHGPARCWKYGQSASICLVGVMVAGTELAYWTSDPGDSTQSRQTVGVSLEDAMAFKFAVSQKYHRSTFLMFHYRR